MFLRRFSTASRVPHPDGTEKADVTRALSRPSVSETDTLGSVSVFAPTGVVAGGQPRPLIEGSIF